MILADAKKKAKTAGFGRQWTASLASASLIGFTLLFFTPLQLFIGNSEEFSVGLMGVLLVHGLAGIMLSAAIACLMAVIPSRARDHLLAPIFGFGVMLYVQGNYFLWDYGLLNGQAIDWDQNASRGLLEIASWATVMLAAVIWRKRLATHLALPAVCLLAIQSIYNIS